MPAKVGRRGIFALVATVATVILIPSATWAAVAPSRNLSLNLPGRVPAARLATAGQAPAVAWFIEGTGSEAFQAAHALLAEAATAHPGPETVTQLIVVRVRVEPRPVRLALTNATTVGELARALPGRSRRSDVVRPSRESTLRPHTLVRITKVRQARETVREAVPFETLIQYSRDVPPGEIRVLTPGRPGLARSTYLVKYRNGRRAAAELVSQDILFEPIDQVEVHSVVEPSIARSAAGATGVEYGEATWYGCAGMHAAHKTLPFGTVVTVTNLDNGNQVTVTITDRGPYAEGRIIDLCDGAFAQIAPLGQGVADVRITF
jgi:Lytic transglycolase/G5 domain